MSTSDIYYVCSDIHFEAKKTNYPQIMFYEKASLKPYIRSLTLTDLCIRQKTFTRELK